jgi:hypothetical protein
VYPEVMFEVARHWYHLFEKHAPAAANEAAEEEPPLQHDLVSFLLGSQLNLIIELDALSAAFNIFGINI